MTFLFVAGKKFAGDEAPDDGWITAALRGAMDRKFNTLSICFISDPIRDFQFENCVLQCVGEDKNVLVDAKATGHKACKWHKNAVKIAGAIIVKVGVRDSGQL